LLLPLFLSSGLISQTKKLVKPRRFFEGFYFSLELK
jgi:hypothetical protein